MRGVPAVYNGKLVSKDNFRTFIYSSDDSRRLVESWNEYEKCMASGLWFASKDDAMAAIDASPKLVRSKKSGKQDDVTSKDE